MPLAPLKPLRRWIWRAFLQSALIPLVLVESVLIGVYLYTNESIRESQVGYLQSSALQDLDSAVRREGKVIDSRLRAIEAQVGVYRDAVAEALADRRFEPDELERQRHASTPAGCSTAAATTAVPPPSMPPARRPSARTATRRCACRGWTR